MEEREGVKEAMEERKEGDGRKVEEEDLEGGGGEKEVRDREKLEVGRKVGGFLQARDTRETRPSALSCCCWNKVNPQNFVWLLLLGLF